MLTVLTKLLDSQRATELIDFVLIFALLLALTMLIPVSYTHLRAHET